MDALRTIDLHMRAVKVHYAVSDLGLTYRILSNFSRGQDHAGSVETEKDENSMTSTLESSSSSSSSSPPPPPSLSKSSISARGSQMCCERTKFRMQIDGIGAVLRDDISPGTSSSSSLFPSQASGRGVPLISASLDDITLTMDTDCDGRRDCDDTIHSDADNNGNSPPVLAVELRVRDMSFEDLSIIDKASRFRHIFRTTLFDEKEKTALSSRKEVAPEDEPSSSPSSEDLDKACNDLLTEFLPKIKELPGAEVTRQVCGGCLDFKVSITQPLAEHGEWAEADYNPL